MYTHVRPCEALRGPKGFWDGRERWVKGEAHLPRFSLSLPSLLFSLPLPFRINLLSLALMQAQAGGVYAALCFQGFSSPILSCLLCHAGKVCSSINKWR